MSRLGPADSLRVAASGLRARPVRVALSALGIAIGIAAMVAVLGISASSRAQLDAVLDRLGTDLLTVSPGRTLLGDEATLPAEAVAMVSRVEGVESTSSTGAVEASVYRTPAVPEGETGGIAVLAAATDLPGTVGAEPASGRWLDAATAGYPAVVLGATAAELLGTTAAGPEVQVWLGGRWFTVVGVLEPVALAPELDSAALVGEQVAGELLGFDGHPTTVYTRTDDAAVESVRQVLAATANPERPGEVEVSRPSDALAARAAADRAFTGLLLGLGAVALVVGGVGVANTMVVSVLERRTEIGLRRALGATRGDVRGQFLTDALVLSALGGLAGVVLGAAVTAGCAWAQGWPVTVPPAAAAGALAVTLATGALAGLYPAVRAARLAPTEALAAP